METFFIVLIVFIAGVVIYNLATEKNATETLADLKKKKYQKEYGPNTYSVAGYGFSLLTFDGTKKAVINNEAFDYSDIIGCDITEQRKTSEIVTPERKEYTATTTTSKGSMAGRTIAGALIAGPVGAVIGGATAKKNTTIKETVIPENRERITRSLYTVTIHTAQKDISHTTGDEDLAIRIKKIVGTVLSVKNTK